MRDDDRMIQDTTDGAFEKTCKKCKANFFGNSKSMVCPRCSVIVKPVVGMGACEILYSDIRSYTIIAVSTTGKTITLQRDKAKLLNYVDSNTPDALTCSEGGFAGHTTGAQRWDIQPDPDGHIMIARLRKNGDYGFVGGTGNIRIGTHSEHYDFNF